MEVGVESKMCSGRSSGVRGFRASRRAILPSVDRAPPPREQLSWNAALLAHGRRTLKKLAALMPLLHRENSRGGNGSSENHSSWAELLGIDTPDHSEPAAAPKDNLRANECGGASEWRWEEPGSPEAAHTPRALVPPACFPTPYPRAFTSFSESAQPGAAWNEEQAGHGITDLVASLKALAMPASSARPLQTSIQLRLSYDPLDKAVERSWPIERATNSRNKRDDSRILPRRASFCGVVSGGSGGEAMHWSGSLPARCSDPSGGFSAKVFLGGLPWDITEQALMHALRHFQPVKVEWPGREGGRGGPRGYAYVTLEAERRVRALLAACRRHGPDWYYRIAHRHMRSKEVIPWALSDSHWVCGGSARLEPARTVFVGALHGMLSASALATIMNDLFAGVVYAGIDTDKNKYPIGSGRVTFNNVRSYVRAISAAYVEITTDKFTKKVQVDPYLEDSMCSVCNLQQGPYFCREPTCFGYFCRACWSWRHAGEAHKPLTRSSRADHAHAHAHRHYLAIEHRYTHSEGTPSPPTSGTAGTSGASDLDAAAAADDRDRWPLR